MRRLRVPSTGIRCGPTRRHSSSARRALNPDSIADSAHRRGVRGRRQLLSRCSSRSTATRWITSQPPRRAARRSCWCGGCPHGGDSRLSARAGVAHRVPRLRPDSAFVTHNAVVMPVDFGMARMVKTSGRSAPCSAAPVICVYAAPEQFLSAATDPRSICIRWARPSIAWAPAWRRPAGGTVCSPTCHCRCSGSSTRRSASRRSACAPPMALNPVNGHKQRWRCWTAQRAGDGPACRPRGSRRRRFRSP